MNDIIRSNIVNLVQNLTNPQTGVPFKLEDEINIVTKNGHVNTVSYTHLTLPTNREV